MTFHNGFQLKGAKILLIGWLGIIQGDFAWFANPLLVFTLTLLYLKERSYWWLAVPISLLTFLLALDTFRFNELRLDISGSRTPVYGFGWGAVLWFAAIATAIVATGTYQKERLTLERKFTGMAELLRWLGIALLIVIATTSVRLYLLDRRHASQTEREYLKDVAFRRGPVCTLDPEPVEQPMTSFNGPLEVITSPNVRWWGLDPLMPLDWGIPMVRLGDRDYWRETRAGEEVIISEPRHRRGESAAILHVDGKEEWPDEVYALTLRDNRGGRLVFHRKWYREARDGRYCPNFDPRGFGVESPRSLLQEALGLPMIDPRSTPRKPTQRPQQITATVIPRGDLPQPEQEAPGKWRTLEELRRSRNRNCPDNVSWANRRGDAQRYARRYSDMPFVIGDVAYYVPYSLANGRDTLCIDDHVYTFKSTAGSGKLYLQLGKRNLAEFRSVWEAEIRAVDPIFEADGWKVLDVQQDDRSLTVALYNDRTHDGRSIRAPWSEVTAPDNGHGNDLSISNGH